MSLEKKDFFGKTVAEAIKQACEALHVPQEELDIEVMETGSTGIFGFIRKKAQIRAAIKTADIEAAPPEAPSQPVSEPVISAPVAPPPPPQKKPAAAPKKRPLPPPVEEQEPSTDEPLTESDPEEDGAPPDSEEPLSQDSIDAVGAELTQLLQLMKTPSKVEVEAQGSSVRCHVSGDFEQDLTGQEGKILDSLQYLLRKITARKVSERIRISIDVGDFREKRQDELEDQARELAALVKEDGKTQVIPSLNPSERRVVHMALQNDKEIRSRSVGDGLFKKVLIYKPGKPKAGNGAKKRPQSRGRRGKGGSKPETNNESE